MTEYPIYDVTSDLALAEKKRKYVFLSLFKALQFLHFMSDNKEFIWGLIYNKNLAQKNVIKLIYQYEIYVFKCCCFMGFFPDSLYMFAI